MIKRRHFAAGLWLSLAGAAHAADAKPIVLYAGATGSIGRIAIPLLTARGYRVRAITRDPSKIANPAPDVEWVRGDVRDPDQINAVAKGITYIVCSVSYVALDGADGPQFVDYMGVRNLVDAGKAVGIKQLVLVSSGNSGPYREHTLNPRLGYVAYWKTKGETYLKQSGVPFTIIGPTGFATDPGGVGGIKLTSRKEFRFAKISRDDVAAVTVAALDNKDAFGKAVYIENDAALKPGAWRGEFAKVQPE